MISRFVAVMLCTALAGCAGLDVGPEKGAGDKGIRYYQTVPFLFVRSDGKGGLTTEIVYLPDTTMTMSVRPYAYLASNDSTLSFSNGTLNEAKMIGDETVVPAAIVDAASKAAAALVGANAVGGNGAAPAPVSVPVPYLFKIIVYSDHLELLGGPAADSARNSNDEAAKPPTKILVNLVPQVSK